MVLDDVRNESQQRGVVADLVVGCTAVLVRGNSCQRIVNRRFWTFLSQTEICGLALGPWRGADDGPLLVEEVVARGDVGAAGNTHLLKVTNGIL